MLSTNGAMAKQKTSTAVEWRKRRSNAIEGG
jgi:hypothetical protein